MAFTSRWVEPDTSVPVEVLAPPLMGGLVDAALPGVGRIGNGDLDREPLGQPRVLRSLVAPITGQCFAQQGGPVPECRGEAGSRPPRVRPLPPGQADHAGGPRHQGADGRAIAGAVDEVALPVAGHRAGGHRGGPSRGPEADAPGATPPAVRSSGLRVAAHTGRQRGSQPTGGCPCRQDTRGGAARHSVRASTPRPDASAQTATARDPGVCARRGWRARPAANVCAVHARDRRPRPALRAHSRRTVLGTRRTTLASARREWPGARPRRSGSRSASRKCVEPVFGMATP